MTDLRRALDPADWPEQIEFVRRLARSLVGSAEAEDVAQDAWLAWLKSPPRQAAALQSWLGTVVRNVVRMRGRASTRRTARESGTHSPGLEPSAADVVAEIDLHRRVVEQVLALEAPTRAVIVLRFHEQRSLEQIATELDIPLETVKSRQKRGLARLRERLAGEDESDRRALLLLAFGGGTAMSGGTKVALAAAVGVVALIGAGVLVTARDRTQVEASAPQVSAPAEAVPLASAAPAAPAAERSLEVAPISTTSTPAAPPPKQPVGGFLATLRGDVVDEAGQPLSGLIVEVFDRDGHARSVPSGSGVTNGAGRFEIAELPFKRRSSATVIAWQDATCVGTTVDPLASASVHVVMPAPCTVAGRVVDLDDRPIEGATIVADHFSRGGNRDGFLVPDDISVRHLVRSDAAGAFEMPSMPRGWGVALQVEHPAHASCRQWVELPASLNEARVTVLLRPEARIEGRVTTADGTPMSGIRVGAQALNDSHQARNAWGEGTTGEDGRYTIRGLERSKWNVFVSLYEEQQREWCALPAEAVELTDAAPHGTVDLTLIRGGELEVRVVDATTREPIADQWIGIESTATPRSGAAINVIMSAEDGIARGRLPPGRARPYVSEDPAAVTWIDAMGERHHGPGFDGTLEEGATLRLTVEIDRGVTLRGIVLDPNGRPVPRASVWSESSGNPFQPIFTTTLDDGSFKLERLPRRDGSWTVRAGTRDLGMAASQIVDPATIDPAHIRVHLVPRPATSLLGCIVDESGLPVAGVAIQVMEVDARGRAASPDFPDPVSRAMSDSDGSFVLHGLWLDRKHRFTAYRAVEKDGKSVMEQVELDVEPLSPEEERDLGDLVLRAREH